MLESHSSPTTGSVPPDWPGQDDIPVRVRLFTKMFSLFPAQKGQNHKARIAAFIEETEDIPAYYLRTALGHLCRQPRQFNPSLGEIRATAARAYAETVRIATGEDVYTAPQRRLRSETIDSMTPRLIHEMTQPQLPSVLRVAYSGSKETIPQGLLTG